MVALNSQIAQNCETSTVLGRIGCLNSIGFHYLTGWVVSAALHHPDMFAAIEHVLEDMETDPQAQHLWVAPAKIATESPVTPLEVVSAPPPGPDCQEGRSAAVNPLGSATPFHLEMPRTGMMHRILHGLFGKRLAA